MALLIKPNGKTELVYPIQKPYFSLAELQGHVGGHITIVKDLAGNKVVVDEEGLPKNLKLNSKASLRCGFRIVGNALCVLDNEIQTEEARDNVAN